MNVALILGEPGTGKTYLANQLIQRGRHPRRRFFVSAPNGGFRGVEVGQAADLASRKTWPPVAIVDGHPAGVLELAVRVGSTTVCVDEVQRLCPKTQNEVDPSSALGRVIYQGRHCRVFLVGVSQYPHEIGAVLRRSAFWLYLFRLSDPYELNYVRKKCGTRVADDCAKLTGHDHILWTPSGVMRSGRVESVSP